MSVILLIQSLLLVVAMSFGLAATYDLFNTLILAIQEQPLKRISLTTPVVSILAWGVFYYLDHYLIY